MGPKRQLCNQNWTKFSQCHLMLKLFVAMAHIIPKAVANVSHIIPKAVSDEPYILSSLPKYERMHIDATRNGNVDVVDHGDGKQTILCHLATIMPFSRFGENEKEEGQDYGAAGGAMGVLLAAHHFNTGNGSIIKEVEGIHEKCDLRFTAQVNNTYLDQSLAVNTVIDLTDKDALRKPCAFLGGFASSVSTVTSLVTGLRGYPQFGALSTSAQLDDTNQYPLFGRLIPSDGADGTSVPLIEYYINIGVENLVVLHTNDAYGNAYASAIQKAALDSGRGFTVRSVEMIKESTAESIEAAIDGIKSTKFRYIFAIISGRAHFVDLMLKAYEKGIAGDGKHNWIFGDNLGYAFTRELEFTKYSALYNASSGIGMIAGVGGMSGMDTYDKLTEALADLNNDADKNYLLSLLPEIKDDPEFLSNLINRTEFFSEPARASPFLYDTIMLLGLSACSIIQRNETITGKNHFREAKTTSLSGSSGDVILNEETGTRISTSALFIMVNFVVKDIKGESILEDRTANVFTGGQWESQDEGFVYNDGTTDPPLDLPEKKVDYGYIGTMLRSVGLCMAALVIILSVGFSFWTHKKKGARVVKASQPFFLHLICLGVMVLASATIPLSIDDEIASVRGCELACQATPWLAATGFSFAFSALFAKTLRVNMIFRSRNFTRVVVTIYDVIIPMLTLLGANILVLTLLTILQPVKWEREITEVDDFGREYESRGYCTYENQLFYTIPLSAINLGVLVLALVQAYRARKISTEFAESEYIAKALVCVLLVCFIGIPVIIIVQNEPKAFFFVVSSIIFVMCSSLLLLIFVPKVMYDKSKDRQGQMRSSIITSMPASKIVSDDEEGLKIVDVEQQQKNTMEENKLLQERTRELELKVQELEVDAESSDGKNIL